MEEERITGNTQWDGLGRPAIFYAMISIWPVGGGRQYLQCDPAGDSAGARRPVCGFNLGDQCVSARGHDGAAAVLDARGELYSYKKVYLSGVAVFTAASALCTFSHTLLMLTVSRAVQGLGAAMIMSVNTSIAKLVFPRRHLGKGVGINATVVALPSSWAGASSRTILPTSRAAGSTSATPCSTPPSSPSAPPSSPSSASARKLPEYGSLSALKLPEYGSLKSKNFLNMAV